MDLNQELREKYKQLLLELEAVVAREQLLGRYIPACDEVVELIKEIIIIEDLLK